MTAAPSPSAAPAAGGGAFGLRALFFPSAGGAAPPDSMQQQQQQASPPRSRDSDGSFGSSFEGGRCSQLWYIHGTAYDLRPFLAHHPGEWMREGGSRAWLPLLGGSIEPSP